MYCPKCGTNNPEGARYCGTCNALLPVGQPAPMGQVSPPYPMYPVAKKANGLSIASLILGLCGIVTCGITSLVGIILGIVGLINIKNSGGRQSGEGLATAGIIVSVFVLGIMIYVVFSAGRFLGGVDMNSTGTCAMHIRELSSVMQMYTQDYDGKFPPAGGWCDALYPAKTPRQEIFRCPAVPKLNCGYGFNTVMGEKSASECARPGETVLLFECDRGWNAYGGREALTANSRHKIGVTFLMVNGQAGILPVSLSSAYNWNLGAR